MTRNGVFSDLPHRDILVCERSHFNQISVGFRQISNAETYETYQ